MDTLTPPVGFYFKLHFSGSSAPDGKDAAFQEVSGISSSLETKEIIEGGENRFSYHLPSRTKYNDLVLKRGYLSKGSNLSNWIEKTMTDGLNNPIQSRNITVQLLDQEGNPLSTWAFINAYPTKWEISEMNAQKSEIMIETITFKYAYFKKN